MFYITVKTYTVLSDLKSMLAHKITLNAPVSIYIPHKSVIPKNI